MNYLVNFYIFIFYFSLVLICYYILGYFTINKQIFNICLPFYECKIGTNFILASWLIILFYFCFRIYVDNETNNPRLIKYKQFNKEAETGDLIIYRWEHVDIGYRMFSKFSHVGMIVKKNNKLYLLETHPDENKKNNKKNNEGVHLYSLKKRIKYYNGECYLVKLNAKCDRNLLSANIIKNLSEYKKIPFDSYFRDLFVYNYFKNLFTNVPNKESMFCSEFIGYILHDNKIYTHNKNYASLNPGSFLDLQKNKQPLYKSLKKIDFSI
jgi:hypothetical protein